MLRKSGLLLLLGLLSVVGIAAVTDAAMVKVAKRLNVIEFSGGYAHPVGSYRRAFDLPFLDSQGRVVALPADSVYDPSFYFGLSYGQLRSDHFFLGLGFRWTHINTLDTFMTEPDFGWTYNPETPTFNQYDIDFNLNYYFISPARTMVAPYAGVGFHAGIISASGNLIETENEFTLALGLNFGADLTLWKAPGDRSFLALSSVNDWLLTASDERPRYLNVGAAIRYYFRP